MRIGTPAGRWQFFLVLVAAILVAVFTGSGCGGKDKDKEAAQASRKALVPGVAQDSSLVAAEDSGLTENTYEAGTLRTPESGTDRSPDELKAVPAAAETAPATPPVSRQATPAATGEGTYSLQLGSFTSLANARKQADRIQALGYKPEVVQYDLGGKIYHRVMLERIGDMAAASKLGEHIHSELGIAYLVRRAN